MKNKNVGFLISGMSIILAILILLFDNSMRAAIATSCSHGPSCSMYAAVSTQTWIALIVVGLVFLIGLFFIFSKESEKIIFKKIKEKIEVKHKPIDYSKLDKEEKTIIRSLEEAQGTIFQSDLVEKTNFGKVKVSRILDRLENKNIIERKRRGMTNVVVLK